MKTPSAIACTPSALLLLARLGPCSRFSGQERGHRPPSVLAPNRLGYHHRHRPADGDLRRVGRAGGVVPNWVITGRHFDPKDIIPHLFEETDPGFHTRCKPGDIIALHDGMFSEGHRFKREATVRHLPTLLSALRDRGFELGTISSVL